MVITICGSMEFAEHMLSIAEDLRFRGNVVYCPEDTETLVRESMLRSTRVRLKRERQLIKKHYDKIAKSDAILVLNFDDERGRGWIGANTFLEIGFAHVLGKKIYVLNPLPENNYIQDEVQSIEMEVLRGDVSQIRQAHGPGIHS